MLRFPKNFFWGTATSAHQIEGDNTRNDWWDAEQNGVLSHKSGRACDSYNRYEEDFDLAKNMHNNAHRFSIEWSRIEPEDGKFDEDAIEHYRDVIQALRARNLEPFVTLHHFTNPLWFVKKGGWTNKKAPEYFERYAERMAEEFGDVVRYWVTINEPVVTIAHGYLRGGWPPFQSRNPFGYFRSLSNIAEAHIRAYKTLHKHRKKTRVGIAKSLNYYEPLGRGPIYYLGLLVIAAARHIRDYWFLDKIRNHQDFIGVQYYSRYRFSLGRGFFHWGNKMSDSGWEIYPRGLYEVLKELYEQYKKPLFITENGVSDADDDQRPDFIRDHLKWTHKAIEEGVDVRGYFHWSLLDNFEWAEGFTQRFGLVEVDFDTFERKMRPSGELYGEICKNNGL